MCKHYGKYTTWCANFFNYVNCRGDASKCISEGADARRDELVQMARRVANMVKAEKEA